MRPWTVTRAQRTPFCSRQSSFCSGSQMMAAETARPSGVADEVLRAGHRVFLVHEGRDHEPPGERHSGAAHGGRGHHRGGQPALHVGAAAPVELPVLDQPAPRRMAPGGGIALGHDVGVPLEAEGRVRARPRRATPMTFGRPGATSCTSTAKPSRRSQASTVRRDGLLVRLGLPGPEDARDPDQRGGEVDDLTLGDLAEDAVDGEAGHLDGPADGDRMGRGDYSRGKARMTESSRRTRNSSPLT